MSRAISKRVVFSYILDWLIICIFVAIIAVFYSLTPHYHDFSVLDPTISYPLHDDTVSIVVCGIVAAAVPAVVIVLLVLGLTPVFRSSRGMSWQSLVKLKAWEINVGLLGLALSLTTALMVAQGLKNFGKPRPNMLARCDPDLSRLQDYVVGGYGTGELNRWVIVDVKICRQTDQKILNDGFQSFPSGHCTTTMAGLFYFTLWLCSRFAIWLPTSSRPLNTSERSVDVPQRESFGSAQDTIELVAGQTLRTNADSENTGDRAAAPPLWTLFIPFIPLGGALYICLSRYMDYAHHGFDIIAGALIGIITSWFSFRFYHMPVSQMRGRAWGRRSPVAAFSLGSNKFGYVDSTEVAV